MQTRAGFWQENDNRLGDAWMKKAKARRTKNPDHDGPTHSEACVAVHSVKRQE